MTQFPPFERWLEIHKREPLPDGMRPTFRAGYLQAMSDTALSLRQAGFEKSALAVEHWMAQAAVPVTVEGVKRNE